MGLRLASTTRANTSTSTGAVERPGAGVDRRSGGQHVVDQDEPPAGHARAVRDLEGALHVERPLGSGEADLLRGRFDTLERVAEDWNLAFLRHDFRERGR